MLFNEILWVLVGGIGSPRPCGPLACHAHAPACLTRYIGPYTKEDTYPRAR